MSGGVSGDRVELTKDWESEDARHRLSKLDVQGHEVIILERMAGSDPNFGMKSEFSRKNQRVAPVERSYPVSLACLITGKFCNTAERPWNASRMLQKSVAKMTRNRAGAAPQLALALLRNSVAKARRYFACILSFTVRHEARGSIFLNLSLGREIKIGVDASHHRRSRAAIHRPVPLCFTMIATDAICCSHSN